MPPKKRKGNVKKPKKDTSDKGDELVEKYRRSTLDVAVLKERLALQTDVVCQAVLVRDELKYQIRDLQHSLGQEKLDMKDITADLSRQYQTLQTDMEAKVKRLETSVSVLQKQLDQCRVDLKDAREGRRRMEEEKDGRINELQSKLDRMEPEYEKALHTTLDHLLCGLSEARKQWEEESAARHREAKNWLTKLGLNPLDL